MGEPRQRTQKAEHAAKLHDERTKELRKKRDDPEREKQHSGYNRSGEAEVVLSLQLGQILKDWCNLWRKEADAEYSAYAEKGDKIMGPLNWLQDETGINQRRLYGIIGGEFRVVGVSQADRILTAIGKTQLLSNGTVRVIPNPNWALDDWVDFMQERGCL